MIINDNKKTSKNIQKFYCEICDFSCSKKGDFMRHIKTIKHNDNQNGNNGNEKTSKDINSLVLSNQINQIIIFQVIHQMITKLIRI